MKKMLVITAITLVVAGFTWTISTADDAAKPVSVQVTGMNVNLSKTLCGEEAPELDATYGGLNALIVKEALDADGKAIEGMVGKMLHYLPLATASKLMAGEENAGKGVTVKGLLYKDAMVIGVKEFTVEAAAAAGGDDWDDWDELGVKTMSQQQVI